MFAYGHCNIGVEHRSNVGLTPRVALSGARQDGWSTTGRERAEPQSYDFNQSLRPIWSANASGQVHSLGGLEIFQKISFGVELHVAIIYAGVHIVTELHKIPVDFPHCALWISPFSFNLLLTRKS